ncbi:MAG: hypothetical protein EHM23_12950 [Acidobacteria bacterium]|nr:MAG: hypothetical protein EHM23_12950 [Acidobacteriota bacterium]
MIRTILRSKRPLTTVAFVITLAGLVRLQMAGAARQPARAQPQSAVSAPLSAANTVDTPWPTTGWVCSSPEQEGMDSARLEQASEYIDHSCPTRFSLLVVRNGRLVFERYYHGSYSSQANNIKSMSKSILSVLTGIALDEGLLTGVDQKLDEFFPEYFRPGDDPRKHDVTLEHLLTMTAGFEWVENGAICFQCFSSPDWHRFTIESQLTSNPGEVFNYNTALTHLLSGILTRVSGTTTRDFATSRLFDPLGMTCVAWSRDPRGYYFGGSEVWFTPRDLAKFGLLFLREGRWEDRQVVSGQWLDKASRLRVRTTSDTGNYGYWFWTKNLRGYPTTLCAGYGGQYIFLIPDLDLAMVTTARSDYANAPYATYADPYNILTTYILPAVKLGLPEINPGGVAHLPDHGTCLARGAFASVSGHEFSLVETTWDDAIAVDGGLPEGIGGVRVFLNGRRAYPSLVKNDGIQFLVPPDVPAGQYTLEIRTPQGSAYQEVEVAEYAPALYTSRRAGRSWANLRSVRPGAVVDLRASGLGPSVPPAPVGAVLDQPRQLAETPEVLVEGRPAQVVSAELASTGIWRLSIRVPDEIPSGPAVVQVRAGGVLSQAEAFLEIKTRPRVRQR